MEHKEISIILPWPPSVNSIWSTTRKGNWFTTKVAREFKEIVALSVYKQKAKNSFTVDDLIQITVIAHPPDNRKRDLDNIFKVLADALQDAGVYENDFQIKRIFMEMREKQSMGKVIVNLKSM